MQLRWRKIGLLSCWATAIILVALAASILLTTQYKKEADPVTSTATESTLYKEVKPAGLSDSSIYAKRRHSSDLPHRYLSPEDETSSRKAAQQAAEDADAAAKR